MTRISVFCDFCKKRFRKEEKKFNESVKRGLKQFCSKECIIKSRIKATSGNCKNCGREINVSIRSFNKSKSKNFFCCRSCAAKYNNRLRDKVMPVETRNKIRQSVNSYYESKGIKHIKKYCLVCGKEFEVIPAKIKRKVCSVSCGRIYQFGSLPYTKEEVITKIRLIAQEKQCAPTTKETEKKLICAAIKFFGSWNNAMKELGFKPNTQWMSKKKLQCKDGHIADSISEMTVDNWLFDNGFIHERCKKYPGRKFTCDFYVSDRDLWIEYFGLIGQHRQYDETVEEKRRIASDNNLNLIEIHLCHLYPELKINEILQVNDENLIGKTI